MKRFWSSLFWIAVAVIGAWAYAMFALVRGEPVNSAYLVAAALCTYALGHRFYSKWVAARVLAADDRRATSCEIHDDGRDFVKTNRWIVFGHHFAAISGPGPLVGPVLAAQFGYLPCALWILIGAALGGAVQDFVILFCSMRRDGRSLGQMVKEELNTTAGVVALAAILGIIVILLAVLALVVVRALTGSPWGVFTVGATIPIALFMGGYLRFWRVGKVMEASAIGIVLLLLGLWGGRLVHASPYWSQVFGLHDITLAWIIIAYGLAASVLPVWLLLAPRDYLSTFLKLGTIFALALGIFFVLPSLRMPALTRFTDGTGLVFAGKVFPFCFITIACGAISGFHTLIASGTTPKLITRESYARHVGYGAMCLESLVAVMALVAACSLEPGIYLSMNVKGAAAATVAKVTALGFPVTIDQMNALANQVGEATLFGRTGGAATLAVGMAQVFSQAVHGRWLDLWYHFAIMFEALFILTTVDAGTRVARYILQDFFGLAWKPLANTRSIGANLLASAVMVCAWGWFLIQGVRDPLGGINSLWPLFGIANQMLAGIALCLATTIILKMQLRLEPATADKPVRPGRPWYALVTLVPLVWLVVVTFTGGAEKVLNPNPLIGFLAHARVVESKLPGLEAAVTAAKSAGDAQALAAATAAVRTSRALRFNDLLDTAVVVIFIGLVGTIVVLSVREWLLLLSRHKPAVLHEMATVWLPDYAVVEYRPLHLGGMAALGLLFVKELSGEAHMDRARQQAALVGGAPASQSPAQSEQQLYLQVTEHRFDGVRRCC